MRWRPDGRRLQADSRHPFEPVWPCGSAGAAAARQLLPASAVRWAVTLPQRSEASFCWPPGRRTSSRSLATLSSTSAFASAVSQAIPRLGSDRRDCSTPDANCRNPNDINSLSAAAVEPDPLAAIVVKQKHAFKGKLGIHDSPKVGDRTGGNFPDDGSRAWSTAPNHRHNRFDYPGQGFWSQLGHCR